MQIVYDSHQKPQEYVTGGGNKTTGAYPDAPQKCPQRGCLTPLPLLKHGFYHRHLVTAEFSGAIKIRRYKCRKCGHTVSMLPSFCLARYVYGVELVVGLMRMALATGSIRASAVSHGDVDKCISRKQIRQYLTRLRENRRLIQYGFNQISPGAVIHGDSPGDIEWTRRILVGERPALSPESNAEFHKTMGMSFMSTQKRIA